MGEIPTIILKSGKDQSLKRFHPWVFSGAIKKIKGNVREGELVRVVSNQDEFLGIGHYQIGSIAIRILSFTEREINADFWFEKIETAITYRERMGLLNNELTNVFRMIHAEGDGLPGLIIDYYNGTAVLQMHSVGMHLNRNIIADTLQKILGNKLTAIYDKSEGTLPHKADINPKNEYLVGKSDNTLVKENGLQFDINWEEGQKTGFFVDQRENRSMVETFSKNRNVLNMFCYTGGFSVYALRGGANLVHSVDSSKSAIEQTNKNVELNFKNANHESFAVDAFGFLDTMDETYDLIILDPPAFAKHNDVLHNALQGYKRLNHKAFAKIKKGGIVFTFSCSQVVSKENFRKSVFAAAANSGRNVRIIHQLSQPADHAVNIYHPEGEYLKGLVLYVE